MDLARTDAAAPAAGVDRAAGHDGSEPRPDRPSRLIGVADSVDRQQRVLDNILDLLLG